MKTTTATLFLATGLLFVNCEDGVYCTEEFRSVGFTWTGASMPERTTVINARTGDTLQRLSTPYEQFVPIADDGSMPQLSFAGDSLQVTVLDAQDSVLATAWYVVGKDDCHIIFKSGPEFLP
ncbi:MAG: hypothetical protein RL738_647 [Bacteroidota bacterium]|jgi:hypothetical protein